MDSNIVDNPVYGAQVELHGRFRPDNVNIYQLLRLDATTSILWIFTSCKKKIKKTHKTP